MNMIGSGFFFFIEYIHRIDGENSSPDGDMQVSTESSLPDGSDKFFTIDESYCPTVQNHPLIFDDIIQKTICYYVENVILSLDAIYSYSIDFLPE